MAGFPSGEPTDNNVHPVLDGPDMLAIYAVLQ